MKKLLTTMLVALLMVGCGEEALNAQTSKNEPGLSIDLDDNETLEGIIAEAIDYKKLQRRGKEGKELLYAPNQQTPYTGWMKAMWGNGQIKGLVQYEDGKMDGLGTEWHSNGQKKSVVNWKDGKPDGLHTNWHENGRKLGYDTYKDGKKDGPSIGWFGNGKKRVEVNYKDGQQQGIRRNWYENGKEKSEYTYKQGKLITATAWKINGERCIETDVVEGDGVGVLYGNDGVVKGRYTYKAGSEVSMVFYVYHPNGQKRSETFYGKGMFDGPQTYTSWNENGEKSSERTYTKGKDGPSTFRTYHPNGQKRSETFYSKGMLDGPQTYTSWNENGEKSSEMNYLGNKKHGSHTFWNTNGKKSAFYNYKNDNLDGLMMLWYKNGQQSSETHYKDGKPDGLSKMWYRDGEKWEKRTWVVGKLIAAVVWKPNGEKCPETKIDQKGNGVVVWYQGVGGKESSREIYKEGFRINDFKKKEKIEEHPNPPTSEYLPVPKHITGLAPIKRQRKIMKYDDGQTMWEEWWDDGTIVSARAWLPNGQQCPDTNVVNGNGVVFWYHENEKKRRRYTYKASKQDGLITHWHENGQKKTEVNYREGKQDGPVIGWYNNGQKKTEANYREGKQDGPVIGWYNNGQKRWESTFKAGKEDGLETWWYSTGQKKWEGNYKEGKLWTAIGWKPNGEKCPVTNILNGNGVIVWYEEDGAVSHRQTYKAGKIVRD